MSVRGYVKREWEQVGAAVVWTAIGVFDIWRAFTLSQLEDAFGWRVLAIFGAILLFAGIGMIMYHIDQYLRLRG